LTISASKIVRSSTEAHPIVQPPAAGMTTAAATGAGTVVDPRAADAAVTTGGAKAPPKEMVGARPAIGPAPSAKLTRVPTNHVPTNHVPTNHVPTNHVPTNHVQSRFGHRGAARRPHRPPGPRSVAVGVRMTI
jgi:hypothetical protein